MRDAAARTIWALAEDNVSNKSTIAKLGGIEPLVSLLVDGGAWAEAGADTSRCGHVTVRHGQRFVTGADTSRQANAVSALVSLAGKHPDNREQICKQLVSRLASRIAMVQTAGGAVRVLGCLSTFASENPSNQLALAKAGAVPILITWISGGLDTRVPNMDAQREAARALLSLATNHFVLQVRALDRL